MLRTLAFLLALAGAQLPGSDATAQVSPQSIAADVKRVADWVRHDGNASRLEARELVTPTVLAGSPRRF